MYTKPVIYKIYSILLFALSVLGFFSAVGVSVFLVFGLSMKTFNWPEWGIVSIAVGSILSSIVTMFISYMNCSSIFTFAGMIEHVESGKRTAYKRPFFALPGKAYSTFGSIVFLIIFIVETLFMLALTIVTSVSSKQFISLPLLPLIGCAVFGFLIYVTYYVRYKSFGNLLTLLCSDIPSEKTKVELSENKPNVLRGFCTFLFICAILFTIGAIAAIIIVIFNAESLSNIVFYVEIFNSYIFINPVVCLCVGLFLSIILTWLDLGVIGCYFDNLAKMLEHFLIQYDLLDYKNN